MNLRPNSIEYDTSMYTEEQRKDPRNQLRDKEFMEKVKNVGWFHANHMVTLAFTRSYSKHDPLDGWLLITRFMKAHYPLAKRI